MLILCNLVISPSLPCRVVLLSLKSPSSSCSTCASLVIGLVEEIFVELFPLPLAGQFLFKCPCLLHRKQQPLDHCLSLASWSDLLWTHVTSMFIASGSLSDFWYRIPFFH